MNVSIDIPGITNLPIEPLMEQLHQVTAQIAPNWPLDQMIAVNPYWPLRHQRIEEVAARLQALRRHGTLRARLTAFSGAFTV